MPRIVPDNVALIPQHAKRVFNGVIFDVYQWPQERFDGSVATFEMLRRPDTVIILALKDDKIVFVDEQQSGRPAYVRLPGGRVEEGEEWDAAAKRELSEEVGMEFANWRLISVHQPIIKIEWFVAVYLATDCINVQQPKPDAGEKIELKLLSLEEAKQHLASTDDPLSEYTRRLFNSLHTLDDIKGLPEFKGKQIQ
jgi:ADP-ribose pyrophosphatase